MYHNPQFPLAEFVEGGGREVQLCATTKGEGRGRRLKTTRHAVIGGTLPWPYFSFRSLPPCLPNAQPDLPDLTPRMRKKKVDKEKKGRLDDITCRTATSRENLSEQVRVPCYNLEQSPKDNQQSGRCFLSSSPPAPLCSVAAGFCEGS